MVIWFWGDSSSFHLTRFLLASYPTLARHLIIYQTPIPVLLSKERTMVLSAKDTHLRDLNALKARMAADLGTYRVEIGQPWETFKATVGAHNPNFPVSSWSQIGGTWPITFRSLRQLSQEVSTHRIPHTAIPILAETFRNWANHVLDKSGTAYTLLQKQYRVPSATAELPGQPSFPMSETGSTSAPYGPSSYGEAPGNFQSPNALEHWSHVGYIHVAHPGRLDYIGSELDRRAFHSNRLPHGGFHWRMKATYTRYDVLQREWLNRIGYRLAGLMYVATAMTYLSGDWPLTQQWTITTGEFCLVNAHLWQHYPGPDQNLSHAWLSSILKECRLMHERPYRAGQCYLSAHSATLLISLC